MMNHRIRTYDMDGKVLYESFHHTAEKAYEEYIRNIKLMKSRLEKGEKRIVARYNEGDLMTHEIIEGAR